MHCDWFIILLLLPTPTIWFSLDHKRNVSDRVVSRVGRNGNILILLTPIPLRLWLRLQLRLLMFTSKRSYNSAYDSDSDPVASENQPFTAQHSDQKTARLAAKRIFRQNLLGEWVNFETKLSRYSFLKKLCWQTLSSWLYLYKVVHTFCFDHFCVTAFSNIIFY